MKTRSWKFVALVLSVALLVALALPAATSSKPVSPAPPAVLPASPAVPGAKPAAPAPASKAPGTEIAQTISMITGVAISPLLGAGAVGAWKYFEAKTPEAKAQLPWFGQAWFWMPALLLVGAAFVKDSFGTMIPTALKKPLDVAETVENKISGLVATGAFVPVAASVFQTMGGPDSASLVSLGFATIDLSWLYNAIMVPIAMIAFVIVWIVGHAINVLILISPFTTVDAALKGFRTALLASVAGMSFYDPVYGAIWALIIILICYCLAGWAFRLTVFGTVFVWDFCTFRRHRFAPDPKANWMFLARKQEKVPVRTYGTVARNEQGRLVLSYRPWLVLARQELVLPEGEYAVGRSLLYPELVRVEGDTTQTIALLPPRYGTHEEELARVYGLGVRDVGLVKGVKAIWNFIKELCGFGSRKETAAT